MQTAFLDYDICKPVPGPVTISLMDLILLKDVNMLISTNFQPRMKTSDKSLVVSIDLASFLAQIEKYTAAGQSCLF